MEIKWHDVHHPKTFARYNEMAWCIAKGIEERVHYVSVRIASAEEMRGDFLGLSAFRVRMMFFGSFYSEQIIEMEFLERFGETASIEIIVEEALNSMVRFMLK